jgi:hypothetical protein
MAWERRGNNGLYYYRKRREGGRVISEYIGRGELAKAIATLDALDRERRELEREAWRLEREEILEHGRMVDQAGDTVRMLTRAWLVAHGYRAHRGQWRRKRE